QFPSDKLFFIQPQNGTESTDLRKAVQCAIELSPRSDSFLVFTNPDTSTLSQKDLRKIVRKHADYGFVSSLGCFMLSRGYAMHLVSTGDTPSISNAIKNGFSAPMSISQIVVSPEDAMKQYATIIKFGTVGASGIAVNLIVLTLLKIVVGALIANVIAQELSIINNFVWNDRFTFRTSRRNESLFSLTRFYRFVKYNLVSLLSLSVNETVFYFAYSQYHVFYITSALLAIAAAFAVNYIGSSRWAWARNVSLSVKD
ncbi:MAG: GtrA family protein, partial [Nitrososphaerales archaeon]